jgi:hypothetical protein
MSVQEGLHCPGNFYSSAVSTEAFGDSGRDSYCLVVMCSLEFLTLSLLGGAIRLILPKWLWVAVMYVSSGSKLKKAGVNVPLSVNWVEVTALKAETFLLAQWLCLGGAALEICLAHIRAAMNREKKSLLCQGHWDSRAKLWLQCKTTSG